MNEAREGAVAGCASHTLPRAVHTKDHGGSKRQNCETMRALGANDFMSKALYLRLICMAAAVDSSVYGYDTAVISGTADSLRRHFGLDPLAVGWVIGSALLGCVLGVLIVGRLTDWLGRRRMFVASALIFLLSAIWCYLAPSVTQLVLARVMGGIGVGFASLLVPVYIAEISPARIRGALVSLHQFGIVTGMTLAYVVNAWIGRNGDVAWLADRGWRVMLVTTGVPAGIFLLLTVVMPESPRWLIKRGKLAEALAVLRRLHGAEAAATEAQEIRATIEQERGRMRELFRRGVRGIMFMAMTLALFQAITGINVIMYYAPSIYTSVGVGAANALSYQVINGVALIAGTISSMFVVDRLGRRPIMLMAITAMGVSIGLMGAFFGRATGGGLGWGMVACTLLYIFAFNFGMGGIYWVMVSEIFPTRIRGAASSLSVMFLWGGNWVVLLMFPTMLNVFKGGVFYLFAAICIVCLLFMWLFVPETKGKTLEHIERELFHVGEGAQVSIATTET
ncbi:MAG TPA: sugar porter family MFS transporter [Steroidobacteraceae bacterium]|nr:sugar porter family MFS transporter [Steroidobacteraceae bacterium]